jgi:hypothetical protein
MKNPALLLNTFTSPNQTFSDLRTAPSYLFPIFLVFLAKAIAFLVYFYFVDFNWMTDQIIQQYADMIPKENRSQLIDSLMNVGKGPFAIVNIVSALFNLVLGCLVFAGYLLLATTLVGGASEKITFRQYFSVASWSAAVFVISSAGAVANTLMHTNGQLGLEQLNPLTLENFFPSLSNSGMLFSFVLRADLALLWFFTLVAIGYKRLTSSSVEKACFVAYFPLMLVLVIQSIIKSMG